MHKKYSISHTFRMNILKPMSDDVPYGLDILIKDLEIHRNLIYTERQNREKGQVLIGTSGPGKSLLAKFLGYINVGIRIMQFEEWQ
jgi:putative ribosome biogenesis GTPase RsgA